MKGHVTPSLFPPAMRRQVLKGLAAFAVFLAAVWAQPTWAAAKVYMSPEKAIACAFPEADRREALELKLTEEQAGQVSKALGQKESTSPGTFYRYFKGDEVLGWSFIQNQMGKHEPMTFQVMMDAKGRVVEVRMLIYRENRGAEVAQKRWMKQFCKKSAKDKLKVGRDVVNYSGATISSNAVTRGVKRALLLLPFAEAAAAAPAPEPAPEPAEPQTQPAAAGSTGSDAP